MKASKFTDARQAFILTQAEEGVPVGDVCRSSSVKKSIQWIDFSAERHQPGDILFLAKEVCRDDAA